VVVHNTSDDTVSEGNAEKEELVLGFEYDDMIARYITRQEGG
jgi:hypothetical protein